MQQLYRLYCSLERICSNAFLQMIYSLKFDYADTRNYTSAL